MLDYINLYNSLSAQNISVIVAVSSVLWLLGVCDWCMGCMAPWSETQRTGFMAPRGLRLVAWAM